MRQFGKHCLVYAISAMLIAPINLLPTAAQAATGGKIYENGTIYTMTDTMAQAKDPAHQAITAEVVITENGKIIFAGAKSDASAEQLAGKETVNLDGRTMVPGFVDPHGHFPGFAETDLYGINLYPTPIGSVDTVEELLKRVRAKADFKDVATPTAPIVISGFGYDDTLLQPTGHPDADTLNQASADKYIVLTHISGHLSVVNRKLADEFAKSDVMVAASQALRDRQDNAATIQEEDREDVITKVELKDGLYLITRTTNTTPTALAGVIFKDDGVTLTGVLSEGAAALAAYFPDSIAAKRSDPETLARTKNTIAYGSQTYAAAGVTTANYSYGSPSLLPTFRSLLVSDAMQIRVVLNPPVDTNFGGGFIAHNWLGWSNATSVLQPGTMNRTAANAGTDGTRIVGDDLTTWSHLSKQILTDTNLAADNTLLTNTPLTGGGSKSLNLSPEELTDIATTPDRFLLGTYKVLYDGSNQGYTGYFKHPGYYDLGHENPWDPAVEATDPSSGITSVVGGIPTAPLDPTALYGLTGAVRMTEQLLNDTVEFYHANGEGVTIHSNGSWANEKTLAAIELAVMKAGNENIEDTRHTIIHAQMQERQQTQRLAGNYSDVAAQIAGTLPVKYENLEEHGASDIGGDNFANVSAMMKKQNIVSSYYVDHTYYWGDRHRNIFMGPGRGQQISPLGWAVEYDHYYTSHCDTPIVPILPLRTLEAAVTRVPFDKDYALSGTSKDINATVDFKGRVTDTTTTTFWDYDQRVNVLQALRAITIYSAFSNKIDDRVGSIENGKYADFVILDENPFTVDPDRLAQIRITTTIVADEVVYGVMPGSKVFASTPKGAIVQKDEALVVVDPAKTTLLDEDVLKEQGYDLDPGHAMYAAYQFEATVTPINGIDATDTLATFQMTITGNGQTVDKFVLQKLGAGDDANFIPRAEGEAIKDGHFWIALSHLPTIPLAANTPLEMNQAYTLFFVIADESATYDAAGSGVGTIRDPLRLVSTAGGLPTNRNLAPASGGGGGCTVSTTPNYDLLLVLFALMGVVVLRTVRRKA